MRNCLKTNDEAYSLFQSPVINSLTGWTDPIFYLAPLSFSLLIARSVHTKIGSDGGLSTEGHFGCSGIFVLTLPFACDLVDSTGINQSG